MSEPTSDPPVPPPNQPGRDEKPAENSSADAETAAATGEDVKMDEAPKPTEETWDDIPEHVLKVSPKPLALDRSTDSSPTHRRFACRRA